MNILYTYTELGGTNTSTEFTDSSKVSYPDDNNFGNYIVACPDTKDKHAEIFLLNQFKALQDTYVGKNKCLPSFVLIYSWCMPCGACTRAIINLKKSSHMSKKAEVTVVYKINYENKDPKNQEKLKEEGIQVYQDKNYRQRSQKFN